jgi:carboxylesterase type B
MPIVLVQINYRLGPFGFAASSDLATEGAGGNYGFVDQQNAFKWVQNHIQDFGGDPCNVTAFGVSAGSASVHYHILSGEARFDRGIMMSGAASTLGPPPLELYQQDWEGLCRRGHLQGKSAQARLKELRSLSAAELLQSARFRASGPMADGRVLPSWRYKASVPVSRCKSLIAGDTHTEAVIFDRLIDATPQDNFHRLVDSHFSQIHAEAFLKAFHFTSKDFPPELYRSTMRDFLSAAVFQFPHLAALEAFGPVGESYLYHFEEPWPVEGPLQGSYHGQCALLMFMNEEDTLPVQTQSVGKELARRWIAFAHGKMPWTSFAAEDQVFMRFGDKAQCREMTLKDDDTRQYGHLEWLRDNFEEVVAFVQGLLFNRT